MLQSQTAFTLFRKKEYLAIYIVCREIHRRINICENGVFEQFILFVYKGLILNNINDRKGQLKHSKEKFVCFRTSVTL